jgi:hypothetical protein
MCSIDLVSASLLHIPSPFHHSSAAGKCLSAIGPRDAVVIDVQSNGGGLVLAGYALLAMVFPQFAPADGANEMPAAMRYLYDEPQGAAVAAIKAGDAKACRVWWWG